MTVYASVSPAANIAEPALSVIADVCWIAIDLAIKVWLSVVFGFNVVVVVGSRVSAGL